MTKRRNASNRKSPDYYSRRSAAPAGNRQTLTVQLYLPRPVALRARREIYNYPQPFNLVSLRRTRRLPLRQSRHPMVLTKVRISIPRKLPLTRGSYTSLSRNRLNIHSYRQYQAAMQTELNRKRYEERKSGKRHARHGQLNSPGALHHGIVAEAYRRGQSVSRIADAALVARAILKGGV